MVVLKSIMGLVMGAVAGFIPGFILGYVALAIVGVLSWDSEAGAQAGVIICILCTLVGAGIGVGTPIKEWLNEQAARAEEGRRRRESQEADLLRQEADLLRHKTYLSDLVQKSRNIFLSIPQLVSGAEQHLDQAEEEFAEGVIPTFWDQIEHATNKLAGYQAHIQSINKNAIYYQEESEKLPVPLPPFDLPTGALPDARATAARFASIVRKAHKIPDFVKIYEMRKTNQLLVAGFSTLGSAIYALGNEISSSLADLSRSLHTSLDELLQVGHEVGQWAAVDAAARRQFEKDSINKQNKQNEMLDNIQRGRKPLV